MADCEVIIIGSGTCVPRKERAGPATVIRMDGVTILVDSAAGTLRRLEENSIAWTEVDYVFYTHFHPDHVGELVPLIFATRYASGFNRSCPIEVFGPEGLLELHANLRRAFGEWVEPEPGKLTLNEIPVSMPASLQLPPLEVKAVHVDHTPHSLAYRFISSGGKTVVVSGDTGYCEEIVELAREADMVVLECSLPDSVGVSGHLSPEKVVRIAEKIGAAKILLTHFYPEVEKELRSLEDKDCFLIGRDGLHVELA